MARQVQLRRGTTSEHSSFTGAVGEVTVDTTKDTVVVHDGSTAGGVPLAKSSDLSAYAQLSGATFTGDVDFGSNKITYANVYSTEGDLPSASTYHGMFAHVHGTGKGYFAHGGNWIKLVNEDTSGNVTISGDLTVNGITAAIIFNPSVITANTTAVANTTHYYLNAGTITLTLPASPSTGDVVKITEAAGNTDCVVGRNGSNIMSSATDLTLDQAYAVIYLQYVNATIGWAFA